MTFDATSLSDSGTTSPIDSGAPSASDSGATIPIEAGMHLTFSDEFDKNELDPQWLDHIWFSHARPDLVDVRDGALHLATDPNDPWGAAIQSAEFAQHGGYFEASIKVSGDSGTWPTFWLLNADNISGRSGPPVEIDVMEGQGALRNDYMTALHRATGTDGDAHNENFMVHVGDDVAAGYHSYGVLWDPNADSIRWFYDGQEVTKAPKFDTTDAGPLAMILSNGTGDCIGGLNPGNPAGSEMLVDWVHVYQFEGGAQPVSDYWHAQG
jgi:hypothetical protein